jgi:hypothetical protein
MTAQHIILLVINIIGGAAVIGSYFFGIKAQSGDANILWGGVPPGVRPVYVVSMLLSALGYFAFIYYLLFRLDPAEVSLAGNLGYGLFYIIFLAMLLPSALWMPLTNVYVANPGGGMWLAVRGVLALVGLASIGLVWALLSLPVKSGAAYWLAVAGSGYFAFHTAVLDAIVWAALFPRSH